MRLGVEWEHGVKMFTPWWEVAGDNIQLVIDARCCLQSVAIATAGAKRTVQQTPTTTAKSVE